MTRRQAERGFSLPEGDGHLLELGRLAGALVHEMKNPLGAISLNADLLRNQLADLPEGPGRERMARRIERIAGSAADLAATVQSFLAFARPGAPDPVPVDINALIEHQLAGLEEVVARDAIAIGLHLDPGVPQVPADRMHLASITANILANACEALRSRDSERKLVVVTRSRPGAARIVIANNGPPIPERVAARLFQPFVSGSERGTGLGLAIVQRLIALYKGTVEVSSDASGVSFTIEFPTHLGPAVPRPALPAPTRRRRKKA